MTTLIYLESSALHVHSLARGNALTLSPDYTELAAGRWTRRDRPPAAAHQILYGSLRSVVSSLS
jgi:hypothetical protein